MCISRTLTGIDIDVGLYRLGLLVNLAKLMVMFNKTTMVYYETI